tara:strand:- start:222 stop:329 length:108 start_codon:yes stop_codon:yes gene_type:complete
MNSDELYDYIEAEYTRLDNQAALSFEDEGGNDETI